jgi:hypothetical protein
LQLQIECANYCICVRVNAVGVWRLKHDINNHSLIRSTRMFHFAELGWSHRRIAGCSCIPRLRLFCLSILLAWKRTHRSSKNNRNSIKFPFQFNITGDILNVEHIFVLIYARHIISVIDKNVFLTLFHKTITYIYLVGFHILNSCLI